MSASRLRIAFGGISHETNCFAPGLTGLDSFRLEWAEGREIVQQYGGTGTFAGGVIAAAQALELELLPGLYTDGNAGGLISDVCARELAETLLSRLEPELDGMVFMLHGAMVSESVFDQESELLRRVRERRGFAFPIAVVLDLHANITQEMAELADILVCEDTYPHVDAYDRGYEATELLVRYIRKQIRPVKAFAAPDMLLLPQTMITAEGPMRTIVDRALAMEQDPRIINIVVAGGFPYSDIPYPGMSFVVTADGDAALARKYADELCRLAWELRHEFRLESLSLPVAMERAGRLPDGPVILVESSDNVGGGGPGDATHLLRYLAECRKPSLIVICDPAAAQHAHDIGVGAAFAMEVGGKTDDWHGAPVRVEGTVRLLSDGQYRHIGPYMTGQPARMGKTAVVACGSMTLVLTKERTGPWDPGHVTSLGIIPETFHIIVVKSALAWRTAFGHIAKHVIHVDTPGCCGSDLAGFPYKHLRRPVFPLDDDHFSHEIHSGHDKMFLRNREDCS